MESIRRKRHVNSLKWTSLFFCEIQNLKRIGFYFNRLLGFLFHSSLYTLDYVCAFVYIYNETLPVLYQCELQLKTMHIIEGKFSGVHR